MFKIKKQLSFFDLSSGEINALLVEPSLLNLKDSDEDIEMSIMELAETCFESQAKKDEIKDEVIVKNEEIANSISIDNEIEENKIDSNDISPCSNLEETKDTSVLSIYFKQVGESNNKPPVNRDEVNEYLDKIEAGDKNAYNEFVNKNLRLVISVAKKFYNSNPALNLEDLIQEGNLGLMDAIKKYDRTKDTSFATYANQWIEAKIKRYKENNGHSIRIPSHRVQKLHIIKKVQEELLSKGIEPTIENIVKATNYSEKVVKNTLTSELGFISINQETGDEKKQSFESIIQTDEVLLEDTVCNSLEQEELKQTFSKMLKDLSDEEREVIYLKVMMNKKLSFVADELNISTTEVANIEKRALRKLKRHGHLLTRFIS